MKPIFRRVARSKALWVAAALVLVYALIGFLLAPYLIERTVPGYAERNLGAHATIGKVRVNPFLLKLEANDFHLTGEAGRPLAAFSRLFVDFEVSSLWHRAWTFADTEVDGLQVDAEIGRDGRFNLADLAERWSKGHPSTPGQQPPRAIIEHFALRDATVVFTDLTQPKPASAKSDPINVEVVELATVPDREGRYTLSAALPAGGSLSWQGELSLQPIASKGEWRITGLQLATVWQFFRGELRLAQPHGTLSVAGRYDFSYQNGAPALKVQGVHAQLSGLSIAREGEQRPLLAFDAVEASDASYDLARHEVVARNLKLTKGTLSASVAPDGTASWQNLVKPTTRGTKPQKGLSPPFRARAENVTIDNVSLHYTDQTRATPLEYTGALHAAFKLDVASAAEAARITGDNLHLTLSDASIRANGSDQALASLKSVAVEGGHFDTGEHTVSINTLSVKGGSTAVARTGDGHLTVVDAFTPARAASERSAHQDKNTASPRWQYVIHAADMSGINVALADSSYKPALRYDVEVSSVALKNVASDSKSPIEVEAALRVAQGGTMKGSGTLAQDFRQASVKLEAAGIDVRPLRPLVAQYTILDLKSGNVSATARLDYRSGGKPVLRAEGGARIMNALVNEADSGDRFVSWKALTASKVALSMSPNRVAIGEIRIQEPGGKIVIAKDHSVNITRVLKRGNETQPAKSTGEPFPVRVARIALQDGVLDYADQSLVLPFSTQVKALNGTIVGLSTAPKSRAELKLEGLIEPNGSASAAGSLEPADPKSFLDINVKFDNVEMPPLSPYTATFAGRKIAAGRLWVDVQYKIVDSQMLGENKIAMADFRLGERVEAPNALNLPLDLAIALLKEPDGRIHLAVPVRGDVNNPKFDYGVLIRDAIANTLTRIVSAPFRFLAGLLGGRGGEDLQTVAFDPGSARLVPAQREQLQQVVKALKERKQLKLIVHGAYAPKRDAQALRDEEVRRSIAQALGVKLHSGQDPGPMAYDDPDTQRALEKLFSARAGPDALDRFAAEYSKKSGKEPHRVNPVLALFKRGSGDRDFYQALFERLVQSAPLPDNVLADLAQQRAQVIAQFVGQAGIDSTRIGLGKTQIVEDSSKPVAAKLELGAA